MHSLLITKMSPLLSLYYVQKQHAKLFKHLFGIIVDVKQCSRMRFSAVVCPSQYFCPLGCGGLPFSILFPVVVRWFALLNTFPRCGAVVFPSQYFFPVVVRWFTLLNTFPRWGAVVCPSQYFSPLWCGGLPFSILYLIAVW